MNNLSKAGQECLEAIKADTTLNDFMREFAIKCLYELEGLEYDSPELYE